MEKCLICGKSEVRIKTDGSKYLFKPKKGSDFICGACVSSGTDGITDGLTFTPKKSEVHTYVRDFSPTAMRRAYIKALFLEDEKWIKHFESQDRSRIINSIVQCKEKDRTEKNLDLQAELKDQIWSNMEYRRGYYESWLYDEVPTPKFNKYLHPDVRCFIRKYCRYKNKTEGMADDTCEFYVEEPKPVPLEEQVSEDGINYYVVFDPAVDKKHETYTAGKEILNGEDRRLSDRGVFGETVYHEQGTDRDITKPKEPSIREALPEEAIILRRRPHTMVTRKPNQLQETRG